MCNFVLDLGLSDSLKIPQFNGLDKRRICIQKNKGRRHWSFSPYYDLFSRIAIPWIVVEMALSLSLATMPASGHVYSHCLTRHTKHETDISAKVVVVELDILHFSSLILIFSISLSLFCILLSS